MARRRKTKGYDTKAQATEPPVIEAKVGPDPTPLGVAQSEASTSETTEVKLIVCPCGGATERVNVLGVRRSHPLHRTPAWRCVKCQNVVAT